MAKAVKTHCSDIVSRPSLDQILYFAPSWLMKTVAEQVAGAFEILAEQGASIERYESNLVADLLVGTSKITHGILGYA